MSYNKKICRCGDCAQAHERALGLMATMAGDNECPIFMATVGEMMVASAITALTLGTDRTAKISELKLAMMHVTAETVMASIQALVNDYMRALSQDAGYGQAAVDKLWDINERLKLAGSEPIDPTTLKKH